MKRTLIYIIFLISTSLFANTEVDAFFIEYKNSNIEEAKTIAEKSKYSEFLYYFIYLNSIPDFPEKEDFRDFPITDSTSYILHYLNRGLYDYLNQGNELAAIQNLKLALLKSNERRFYLTSSSRTRNTSS